MGVQSVFFLLLEVTMVYIDFESIEHWNPSVDFDCVTTFAECKSVDERIVAFCDVSPEWQCNGTRSCVSSLVLMDDLEVIVLLFPIGLKSDERWCCFGCCRCWSRSIMAGTRYYFSNFQPCCFGVSIARLKSISCAYTTANSTNEFRTELSWWPSWS